VSSHEVGNYIPKACLEKYFFGIFALKLGDSTDIGIRVIQASYYTVGVVVFCLLMFEVLKKCHVMVQLVRTAVTHCMRS